jgi:hypothetical protein
VDRRYGLAFDLRLTHPQRETGIRFHKRSLHFKYIDTKLIEDERDVNTPGGWVSPAVGRQRRCSDQSSAGARLRCCPAIARSRDGVEEADEQ